MWQLKLKNRDDPKYFEGVEDISDFDTPPSSPETIFDDFSDDEDREVKKKTGEEEEMDNSEEDNVSFNLSSDTFQSSAEALVVYMAFYIIKKHKEMEDSILKRRMETKNRQKEKRHYKDFLQFYLSVRSQKSGVQTSPNSIPRRSDQEKRNEFLTPPGFLPNLLCGSQAVDTWFGLTIDLLETLKEIVILQRENTEHERKNKTNEHTPLPHLSDDPQLPICDVLFSFLMEIVNSPNVKINIQVKDLTDTPRIQMTKQDKKEVRACFAVAPPRCPVCPQLAKVDLCCVRYSLPEESKDGKNGVFSRRSSDLRLPPPMLKENVEDMEEDGPPSTQKPPPHFFISSIYAEKIESFWVCQNMHNIVAREAFHWCNIKSMAAAKDRKTKDWFSWSINKRLSLFQKTQVKQLVTMWDKHLKRLNDFCNEFRKFLDKMYEKVYDFVSV